MSEKPPNPISKLINESFGFIGKRNLAAWALATGLAYVYFVVPAQNAEKEAMVRDNLRFV